MIDFKLEIAKKCYTVNMNYIDEAYLYDCDIFRCYAKSRSEAKAKLLKKLKIEGVEKILNKSFYLVDVNYLNIPVLRYPENDTFLFEGMEKTKCEIESILIERKRINDLDQMLLNTAIEFCYILKRGYYYRPNCNGYTEYVHKAGVYTKIDAVKQAKSCNELSIVPINVQEHNQMILTEIDSLKSSLIQTTHL